MGAYPKSTVLQTDVSHRLGSRAGGGSARYPVKVRAINDTVSAGLVVRRRQLGDHAVRGMSVIDAVTALTSWMSDAFVTAAIRSTSVRSR